MINSSSCFFFLIPLFFFSSNTHFCYGADAISSGQSLFPNQTLVSKVEETFELGFFIKDNSPNVYVGIWYRKLSLRGRTVVWVANRDDPLIPDGPSDDLSSSELKLLDNGNLVLLNQSKRPIWSTNSTSTRTNSSKLVLGDDGNLVLRHGPNPSDVFWQSFDHPTDTWLPGGKLGYDNITKTHRQLISWKNSEDPARGMFSVQIDRIQKQYIILRNRSQQYWNSGPWDGQTFSFNSEVGLKFSYVSNENESYFTYSLSDKSIAFRFVMDSSGQIKAYGWVEITHTWNIFLSQPSQQCEVYAFCGTYSTCDERGLRYCQCLPGFKPRSSKDWNTGDYSGGCVRNTTLHCGDQNGFQLLPNIKLPLDAAVSFPAGSDEKCKLACLNNCNCTAYSYPNLCSIWNGDLLNLELTYNYSEGSDLYFRSAVSEKPSNSGNVADEKKRAKLYIIISVAVVGTIILSVSACILCRMKVKSRGRTLKSNIRKSPQSYLFKDQTREREGQELPLFDFSIIASCTNNFTNKLGEGGFGPVYKGKLLDGQDIAVKRLSRSSGQGIEEFRNELKLISKLQHRNLVRLVGYCIEDEEKILIYEYMPNKSLDAFLFDPIKRSMLDWDKRFNIIDGIARGLLYLHRDSRLRIIHRDLKVSNILLDEDLNPKISDFGMARIFGGNQTSANTNRVVGTYGYMSPEYAMGGIISEKSDVFSFGVLLLEILSSRRNTSFYYHEKFLNLLGYAWALWNEGKALELIDPKLVDESSTLVLTRCIHVGLLCVQEHADDRPTMPTVVFMIDNETILPSPKQPAFIRESTNLQSEIGLVSVNNVTVTSVGGR